MGFAYNSTDDLIVMFGGTTDGADSAQTWLGRLVNGDFTWQMPTVVCEPTSSVCPAARHSTRMTYDSANNLVVLFGGIGTGDPAELNDTWTGEYTAPTFTWTLQCDPCPMSDRSSPGLTYANGFIVLYGGSGEDQLLRDTWVGTIEGGELSWDGACSACAPGRRSSPALAYTSGSGADVVLFGGFGSTSVICPGQNVLNVCGDTWTFNPSEQDWTERTQPPLDFPEDLPRSGHRMVFDSLATHQFLVMFGGYTNPQNSGTVNNETWIGRENGLIYEWEEVTPTGPPGARCCVGLAYDSEHDLAIMFGGGTTGDPPTTFEMLGDTWGVSSNWQCLLSCPPLRRG